MPPYLHQWHLGKYHEQSDQIRLVSVMRQDQIVCLYQTDRELVEMLRYNL
jgi:hypothetical protein